MSFKIGFIAVLFSLCIVGCKEQERQLPFLGTPEISGNDTIYPVIEPFSFINQDSNVVTNATFQDKIYVADFIFLSCPTICPMMNQEMKKVYNHFKDNKDVLFLSHTIDPKNDSVSHLKMYANSLKVDQAKWHFVTGKEVEIHRMAEESYYSIAYADSTAPGGFAHSGGFLLIDKKRHIRGVYDGTDAAKTKELIRDIELLLQEK